MMYRIRAFVAAMVVTIGLVSLTAVPAGAVNPLDRPCSGGNAKTTVCTARSEDNVNSLVRTVINTLLFVIGILAVIMIIVGGIKYTTSNGDAAKITSSKNTVLYSVVGLVVALLAFVIVNYVLATF